MKPKNIPWAKALLIAILVTGCNGGNMNEKKINFKSLSEVPASKWEQLSQKNIYFGHQSVGYNILDGIRDVMKENPHIKLNIVESTDFDSQGKGAFFHSAVGENMNPSSKMKDFERIMTGSNAEKIDLAFLKFCYVDILSDSNPEKIFNEYKETIKRIENKNSKSRLIHLTAPLTTIQSGIKAWVKNILGKPLHGMSENIKRTEYNNMVVNEYDEKGSVFDLARIESTKPDGTRTSFDVNGKTYYALTPEYTYDGGHLNELSRKIVAEQLLLFLANQINLIE